MNIDKNNLLKGLATVVCIIVIVVGLSKLLGGNSRTLSDYAAENPDIAYRQTEEEQSDEIPDETVVPDSDEDTTPSGMTSAAETDILQNLPENQSISPLIGVTLNGSLMENARIVCETAFYYEPLSDNLRRYITGVSYPENGEDMVISYDDLRYVHVLHYDFEGNPAEGELICNEKIAQDLVEIFYELYKNQYQIEKMLLIDEYDGDDLASMEDNNTSCFNYRLTEGSTNLSKHAYGLAIDINPFYNPYITYGKDGSTNISPVSAQPYADRSRSFPYKIDDSDLCYKLFAEQGFIWGGNWNSSKDYQHFQKTFD